MKPKRWLIFLLGSGSLLVVFAISGFAFAAYNETHDEFCASCHTQPETIYYQRSLAVMPTDLASAHQLSATRCIDCHSGEGVVGRLQAELLGARNATAWITQLAIQPAPLTVPIADENCLKCHQQLIQPESWAHYHAFLAEWKAKDSNAASCVACHHGHVTNGNPSTSFINQSDTRKVCDNCHRVLHKKGS